MYIVYIDSIYENIMFIMKKEQNQQLLFLDVLVTRTSNEHFSTGV